MFTSFSLFSKVKCGLSYQVPCILEVSLQRHTISGKVHTLMPTMQGVPSHLIIAGLIQLVKANFKVESAKTLQEHCTHISGSCSLCP